jgi:hypothetical protein
VDKMNEQQSDYLEHLEKLEQAQKKLQEDIDKAHEEIDINKTSTMYEPKYRADLEEYKKNIREILNSIGIETNDTLTYSERLKKIQDEVDERISDAYAEVKTNTVAAMEDKDVASLINTRNTLEMYPKGTYYIRDGVIENSVKPGVKVSNIRKKVAINKKSLAIGACVLLVSGGVVNANAEKIANTIRSDKIVHEAVLNYSENYVSPNTHYNVISNNDTDTDEVVHWHDYSDIFMKAKYTTDDPVVAFYLAYDAMGEDCLNKGISSFNRLYNTDYESVNDFLIKNNFQDKKDWKINVAKKIQQQKEDGYGNSNTRG